MLAGEEGSGDADPRCLLVLVTGLPGAGKSAFLDAVGEGGCEGNCGVTNSLLCGVDIVKLKLDDFLHESTASSTSSFTPERWREATQRLAGACQAALVSSAATVERIVFVEDNMHYQSMRERYWRLCRDVSATQHSPPRVAMLELRFDTPLETCLRRNELRHGTTHGHVPPLLIASMNDLFETGLRGDAAAARLCSESGEPLLWVVAQNHTRPWVLMHLSPGTHACEHTAAELAAHFATALRNDSLRARLKRQVHDRAANAAIAAGAEVQRQNSADSYGTASHRLDLALRRVVHHHLQSQKGGPSSERRKAITAQKRAVTSAFKLSAQGSDIGDEERDAFVHDAVLTFRAFLEDTASDAPSANT